MSKFRLLSLALSLALAACSTPALQPVEGEAVAGAWKVAEIDGRPALGGSVVFRSDGLEASAGNSMSEPLIVRNSKLVRSSADREGVVTTGGHFGPGGARRVREQQALFDVLRPGSQVSLDAAGALTIRRAGHEVRLIRAEQSNPLAAAAQN